MGRSSLRLYRPSSFHLSSLPLTEYAGMGRIRHPGLSPQLFTKHWYQHRQSFRGFAIMIPSPFHAYNIPAGLGLAAGNSWVFVATIPLFLFTQIYTCRSRLRVSLRATLLGYSLPASNFLWVFIAMTPFFFLRIYIHTRRSGLGVRQRATPQRIHHHLPAAAGLGFASGQSFSIFITTYLPQ